MNKLWKWAVVAFVSGSLVLSAGALFKVLHWAGANEMLVAGLVLELTSFGIFITWYIRFGSKD